MEKNVPTRARVSILQNDNNINKKIIAVYTTNILFT